MSTIPELRRDFPWCQRSSCIVSAVRGCPYVCYNCTFYWFPNESVEAHRKRISLLMWDKEMLNRKLGGRERDGGYP